MSKINFEKRLLVGITGRWETDWQNKLEEIKKLKIKECSLFLERFDDFQRKKIYKSLLDSCVKKLPLVHIKNAMEKEELEFLEKNFKPECYTIHETGFNFLQKWKGFYKKMFLEMDISNYIPENVDIKKIGGFCVDLSHFKTALTGLLKEFEYTEKRKSIKKYFICNHLNGYSFEDNRHKHTIDGLKDFDYLKTLPKFVFGKYIALEMENSVKEQLKFKKYLIGILSERFYS